MPKPIGLAHKKMYGEVGKTIRLLRESRGMSQRELGELLCITQEAVLNIEKHAGGISLARAVDLSEIFGVSLNYLAGHKVSRDEIKNIEYVDIKRKLALIHEISSHER